MGDSPEAAVDYSVTEAVDHPTGGASLTPSRKVAQRHQAVGKSHCSVFVTYQEHKHECI